MNLKGLQTQGSMSAKTGVTPSQKQVMTSTGRLITHSLTPYSTVLLRS